MAALWKDIAIDNGFANMTGKEFLERGAGLRATQIILENQVFRQKAQQRTPRTSANDDLERRHAAATEALNEHISKFLRGD